MSQGRPVPDGVRCRDGSASTRAPVTLVEGSGQTPAASCSRSESSAPSSPEGRSTTSGGGGSPRIAAPVTLAEGGGHRSGMARLPAASSRSALTASSSPARSRASFPSSIARGVSRMFLGKSSPAAFSRRGRSLPRSRSWPRSRLSHEEQSSSRIVKSRSSPAAFSWSGMSLASTSGGEQASPDVPGKRGAARRMSGAAVSAGRLFSRAKKIMTKQRKHLKKAPTVARFVGWVIDLLIPSPVRVTPFLVSSAQILCDLSETIDVVQEVSEQLRSNVLHHFIVGSVKEAYVLLDSWVKADRPTTTSVEFADDLSEEDLEALGKLFEAYRGVHLISTSGPRKQDQNSDSESDEWELVDG